MKKVKINEYWTVTKFSESRYVAVRPDTENWEGEKRFYYSKLKLFADFGFIDFENPKLLK